MHRHGTMKGRWKALAFGAFWVLLGGILTWSGLRGVFAGAVPRPPGGLELLAIAAGASLCLFGFVLGVTPHVIWLLRTLYKEDFAPGATCPVMLVCPSCATYNPRGRAHCKACRTAMSGARAAGGGQSPSVRA